MELRTTPAQELDTFIQHHLLPDKKFRRKVNKAINIICSFLKEDCFPRDDQRSVLVSKVVKGGSSGKGTALRGRSDADLVIFVSCLGSFQEQFDHRGEVIQSISTKLKACQRRKKFAVKVEIQDNGTGNPPTTRSHRWGNPGVIRNPRALGFTLSSKCSSQEGVEFDVLPAFDVLGQVRKWKHYRPQPQIYEQLIKDCRRLGKEGEFSTCFTELQRAFLKHRPPKLKNLIRLVKCWYRECKEELGQPLPPQYALELLTVYAWEHGSGEANFSTAQGFRTVLKLIMNYHDLCIYWTKYYNMDHPYIGQYLREQLQKPRPVILDPADPTGNVGADDPKGSWERLKEKAEDWLGYPCCKNSDGGPVDSWCIQEEKKKKRKSRQQKRAGRSKLWTL